MAKKTLLEIVQSVLTSLNSDDVDNINDTIESTQVALIAKEVFEDLTCQSEWPKQARLGVLEALGDTAKPTYMVVPDSVYRIKEIRYETTRFGDADRSFKLIEYVEPSEFIDIVSVNKSSDTDTVEVETDEGVTFFVRSDTHPSYWTTFDNVHIVFDSFDSFEDSTLQSAKTQCLFHILPDWDHTNGAIPDLDERFFPTYLAEVKRVAHLTIRQQPSIPDEQRVMRGKAMLRQQARVEEGADKRARFGRR
jgi:hypothetical protein